MGLLIKTIFSEAIVLKSIIDMLKIFYKSKIKGINWQRNYDINYALF